MKTKTLSYCNHCKEKNKNLLTFGKEYATLLIVTGAAVFLCPNEALSKVDELNRYSCNSPNSAFFIGGEMPTGIYKRPLRFCNIDGCGQKHCAKGLCQKHYCEKNKEHLAEYFKQYHKKWWKRNKKRCTEQHKQYYQRNVKLIVKRAKYYREENKEKMSAWKKLYYQANKEKFSKYGKTYYQNNKEKISLRIKRWGYSENGKVSRKVSGHNRRALEKSLTKKIVSCVYRDNIKQYGVLTCVLCGGIIPFGEDSLEHLIPLSRGGTNNYDNLGIAHLSCNLKKGTKTTEEWLK